MNRKLKFITPIWILLIFIFVLSGCSKNNSKVAPIIEADAETTQISTLEDQQEITNNSQDTGEYVEAAVAEVPSSNSDIDNIDSETTEIITTDKVTTKTDYQAKTKVITSLSETESKKKIIAIDAGHQSKGNYKEEPIGPGAKITKPKVSSGTQGSFTGVPEYKLTLVIAKKVKKELVSRGYEVVMIREKNNVNLSNKERAEIANKSGADAFIRIHADGSTNPVVNGASTLYPSKKNPYVPELSEDSYNLAKSIIDALCESTGAKNRGAIKRDDMSGINWSEIPVTIIEMGYMTNKKEDKLMQTEDYQDKIVQGICDGIDQYFE